MLLPSMVVLLRCLAYIIRSKLKFLISLTLELVSNSLRLDVYRNIYCLLNLIKYCHIICHISLWLVTDEMNYSDYKTKTGKINSILLIELANKLITLQLWLQKIPRVFRSYPIKKIWLQDRSSLKTQA